MSIARKIVAAARMPAISWAFSGPGFRRHARRFAPDALGRLDGQRCVVTGATSGLGLAAARQLAGLGADLFLVGRDRARGQAAVAEVAAAGGRVELIVADLADLGQVRRVAAELPADRLDVLIHNAGSLPRERIVTGDGLEQDFALHVAAPHLLTHLTRARLAAGAGRVVWVSSGGMYSERLRLDDLGWTARPYDGVVAYAQAKRAQVALVEEWAARAPELAVFAMHPGWADTPGVQASLPGFYKLTRPILRTADEGADTIAWLAAARDAPPSGGFYFDRAPAPRHILPGTAETADERAQLWRLVEAQTAPPG